MRHGSTTKTQKANNGTEESREVTFLSAVRGKVVLHRYDYTSEERLATWWDATEIERMRKSIEDMEVPPTAAAGSGYGEYDDDNEPGSMIESSISEDSASSFSSSSSTSSFSSFRALQIKEPPMVPRSMRRRRRREGSSGKDKKPIKVGSKDDSSTDTDVTDIASTVPLRSCMVKKEKSSSSSGEEYHQPFATSPSSEGQQNRDKKKFKNLKVSFARSKMIRPALHRNHFTPAERYAVWYNKEDLLRIKRDNLQTIRSMSPSSSPSSSESSSSSSSSSFSKPHWRGLEKQTRLGVIEKNEIKRIAREAVFEEQAVQKLTQVSSKTIGSYNNSNNSTGKANSCNKPRKRSMSKKSHRHGGDYVYDVDAIAKVYRDHTKKSEEEALAYGLEDELAAAIVGSSTTPTTKTPSVTTTATTASFVQPDVTKRNTSSGHLRAKAKSPSSKSTSSSWQYPLAASSGSPTVVGVNSGRH